MGLIENYTAVAIVLSALAPVWLKVLRRPSGYLALSTIVAIVAYRGRIAGYLFWIVALFALTRAIERFAKVGNRSWLNRWSLSCAAMFAVLMVYAAGALGMIRGAQIGLLGISFVLPTHDMWLLVRTLSFLWESGAGRIKENRLVPYATWIVLPFTVSGPLLRYGEFIPQYHPESEKSHLAGTLRNRDWWMKLALAAVQIAIGVALNYLSETITASGTRWTKALIIFVTGPWGFYLGASGLFHLMECLAMLWGIELPPSFNWPFGQRNLAEFWNRWNMTVTRVCRDYLFYNRWGFKRANIYVNTMLLFLAVGLWHDMNLYWGSWGMLHGIGFCIYLWYRTHKEQFAFATSLGSERVRAIVSASATYVFVCLCWYVATKISLLLHHGPLPNHLH